MVAGPDMQSFKEVASQVGQQICAGMSGTPIKVEA